MSDTGHLSGLFREAGTICGLHALEVFMPLKTEGSMDRFIQDRNIQRYRKLLVRVSDETQRAVLLKLLANEEAKQAGGQPPKER